MSDAYNLYKEFDEDGVIFSFKGHITTELLSAIYEMMEKRLEADLGDHRLKKKFYHILTESLQNVFHHAETQDGGSSILIISHDNDRNYHITTGNFILNSDTEALKATLEKINAMSPDELRAHHRDKLNTTELSAKGGAGLGIIDMARKSGHKIAYDFKNVSDSYSFFTLTVTVK